MTTQRIEQYGIRHTYVEYMSGGVLTLKRAWLTDKTEVKVSNAKLDFSGDGQKYTKNYGYQASGSVEFMVDDTTVDSILWANPAVSPLTGDDFATRYVKGGDAEMQSNFVGLRISIDASDADTGAPIVVRFRILRVQFDPDNPGAQQSQKNGGRLLTWNARRTNVAIDGTTPTGMPANGCYWFRDYLTDSTKFDPVAGDIAL